MSNELNKLKIQLASKIALGELSFASPLQQIEDLFPEYTLQQINEALSEIIFYSLEEEKRLLEVPEDYFDHY